MSYILEALKKSEEKRKQDTSPSHLHAPGGRLTQNSNKSAGKNIILIVACCTLFSLFGWLLAKYTNNTTQLPLPVPTIQEHSTRQEVQIPTIPELRPKNNKIPPPAQQPTEEIVLEPQPLPPQVGKPQISPQTSTHPSDESEQIPLLKDLEEYIREEIPELKLAGHVYSPDPSLRLILINSDIKREKESITKELTLDEIIPDGVIIDYNNYIKFRLSVK